MRHTTGRGLLDGGGNEDILEYFDVDPVEENLHNINKTNEFMLPEDEKITPKQFLDYFTDRLGVEVKDL